MGAVRITRAAAPGILRAVSSGLRRRRLVLHHLSGRIPFKCRSCGFGKVDRRVAVLDNVDADLVFIDCLGPLAEQLAR